ncbi:MAG: site-specific integrase [Acidimicrobiia bacterium]
MTWVASGDPAVHRQRDKWVLRQSGYEAATGRRRVRQLGTFQTLRAARAAQRDALRSPAPSAATLTEYLEGVWLPAKAGRVERTTADQYSWAVRCHIVPLIGAARLTDLSPEVLDQWIGSLVSAEESGAARLSATSARLVRKVLSMALDEAVQRGRIPRNPVALTQPPRPPRRRGQAAWTLDEVHRFLGFTAEHRLGPAFHLAVVTGLRRGELLGLRWADLDLAGHELHVTQQLAIEGGRPRIKDLKTSASERVVTFGPVTTGVLRTHAAGQDRERDHAGPAWAGMGMGLVFTTPLGGWVDPSSFGRHLRDLIAAAAVTPITPRGLRRTAQSLGRAVVGDDKVMQERLGHTDIGVTLNTYTHTVDDHHRQAGLRIDALLGTRTAASRDAS